MCSRTEHGNKNKLGCLQETIDFYEPFNFSSHSEEVLQVTDNKAWTQALDCLVGRIEHEIEIKLI